MWQHSQICCHGMPQAVVLGTKRDRGLSGRGATLRGLGELHCHGKRKKSSQDFPHTPLPLFPSSLLQNPSTSNNHHQQHTLTTNYDTHAHPHSSHPLLHDDQGSFGRCHAHIWPTSLSLSFPLSVSPCLQCLEWSLLCSTVNLGTHLVHSRTGYTESSCEYHNHDEDKQHRS